jgi:hypothetical protein
MPNDLAFSSGPQARCSGSLGEPAGHGFGLGDNRNSRDARPWGPSSLANLTGKPSFL